MAENTVQVSQKFVHNVRMMLVRMAVHLDGIPQLSSNTAFDKNRQYAEGYLGIKRDELKSFDPQLLDKALDLCGLN